MKPKTEIALEINPSVKQNLHKEIHTDSVRNGKPQIKQIFFEEDFKYSVNSVVHPTNVIGTRE